MHRYLVTLTYGTLCYSRTTWAVSLAAATLIAQLIYRRASTITVEPVP